MAEITYYPYGNAHITKETAPYEFSCQHGTTECEWNQIETCAINLLARYPLKYFNFIECIEENDHGRVGTIDYDGITTTCATKALATSSATDIIACRTST
jgi:hypothetical protein